MEDKEKKTIYYLAINYGTEGWKLKEYESSEELLDDIEAGETVGFAFKILKEIKLRLTL